MDEQQAPGVVVGRRVRQMRQERGLSLSALARAAGIGKGSLSELESGRRNPTLDTLYAVAGPLGVPLAALVDDAGAAAVADDALGIERVHVAVEDHTTTEVYLLTIGAGATRRSPAHAPGTVEQLVVLSGECRLEVEDEVSVLAPGDHARWRGDVVHAYGAGPGADVRAVNVIVTPGSPA